MNDQIAREIKRRLPAEGRRVVFVCGLGGAGKTEFCRRYARTPGLEGPILHLDWYLKYPSRERRRRMAEAVASEDPARIDAEENSLNWQDWPLTIAAIRAMRKTGKLHVENGWIQATGEKTFTGDIEAGENDVIWCDLVSLLHPEVASLADVVILLEVSPDTTDKRGNTRDQHRNDPEYLAYKAAIRRKYDTPYFRRYRTAADLIIDNSDFEHPKVVS